MHQFDAIATAASEYHADLGFFPTGTVTDYAAVHSKYATFGSLTSSDTNTHVNCTATISGVSSYVDSNTITLVLRYDETNGYDKNWNK